MDAVLHDLEHDEETRRVVWGLMTRGIAGVYLLSYVSIAPQILGMAGSGGMDPFRARTKRMSEDFGSWWERFKSLPSVFLWLPATDFVIQLLPLVGALASALALVGGAYGPLWFVVAWVVYFHIDPMLGLGYPWDCLLFEAGFLAMFFPSLPSLVGEAPLWQRLQASALPMPLLGWQIRWLLVRVLVGFGKLKFSEPSTYWLDRLYIKYFYIYMPIPSPLGWLGNKLPDWVHVASLVFMFVSELITPWLVFFTGPLRAVGGISMAFLMVGIQLTGNFGYFNLLTMLLCIGTLDLGHSLWDQQLPSALWSVTAWQEALGEESVWSAILRLSSPLSPFCALTLAVFALLLPPSVFFAPLSSWVTGGGFYWVAFDRAKPSWLLRPLLRVLRFLVGSRFVHAYGVFPPNTSPAARWTFVYQGSEDGRDWKSYKYRFFPVDARSGPVFVAPHHPRLDHAVFYDSLAGFNGHNFIAPVGNGVGYNAATDSTPFRRVLAQLLSGEAHIKSLFANDPFPDHPPRFARAVLRYLRPTSLSHWWSTGEWWEVKEMGQHFPPVERDSPEHLAIFASHLQPPETWSAESFVWRKRVKHTRHPLTKQDIDIVFRFVAAVRTAAAEATSILQRPRSVQTLKGDIPSPQDAIDLDDIPLQDPEPIAKTSSKTPKSASKRPKTPSKRPQTTAPLSSLTSGRSPLPQALATRLFSWRVVRQVRGALRHERFGGMDDLALLQVEQALGRLAAPLLSRLWRLFHRVFPGQEEIRKEARQWAKVCRGKKGRRGGEGKEEEEGNEEEEVDDDDVLDKTSTTTTSTSPSSSPSSGSFPGQGFAALRSAEWEDWEEEYCSLVPALMEGSDGKGNGGALSDAFRLQCWVHWLILVGGQDLVEQILGLDTEEGCEAVLDRVQSLFGEGEAEPLGSIFVRFLSPTLHPSYMSSENGVFLQSLFRYDSLAHAAQHGRIFESHTRKISQVGSAKAHPPLPGWLHIWQGLGRQSQIRRWDPMRQQWDAAFAVPLYDEADDGTFPLLTDGIKEARDCTAQEEETGMIQAPPEETRVGEFYPPLRSYDVPAMGPADGCLKKAPEQEQD